MFRRKVTAILVLAIVLSATAEQSFAQPGANERNITRSDLVLLQPLNAAAPSGNAGLFVGVNDFIVDRHINGLQFAVHDAIELAYLFVVELKLIPARNCHLLLSGQPSADSVRNHLAELKQKGCAVEAAQRSQILAAFLQVKALGREPSDLLVCAFSSHGFNEGRQAFIMPSDGSRELLGETAIPMESIETRMESSQAGHRLLLVDACQERISAKSTSGDSAGTAMSTTFLDALKRPTGQAKLASCSPGEFSYEHGSLGGVGHGIFTHSFLEALRGGAQPDSQNLVRLGTVADYVSGHVISWAKEGKRKPQTPFFAGPEAPRQLPLALKGDSLAALIVALQKRPTTGEFTAALRDQLVAALSKLDKSQEADRLLAFQTREFTAGRLSEVVYVPYLERALARRPRVAPRPLVAPFDAATARRAQQEWAKHLGTEVTRQTPLGMKLQLIPPGEFLMGSSEADVATVRAHTKFKAELIYDEKPQHPVRLTRPYYLAAHEVTQGQYEQVMGTNPSYFSPSGSGKDKVSDHDTSHFPVESVTWYDAVEFCNKLSEREGKSACYRLENIERADGHIRSAAVAMLTGSGYRLPTEAEWEYACRSGTTRAFHFGNVLNGEQANVNGNFPVATTTKGPYLERTTKVGSYAPNGFGLYDMHGNVWEWCSDYYGSDYYKASPGNDPVGSGTGSSRVSRGGGWYNYAALCQSAYRDWRSPDYRYYRLGFRVALGPSGQ